MPVPEEAEAIAEAVRDYAAGAGFQEIARRWNAQGLRPHSKQGLTLFTISSVQSVIENDFYAGFVRYKGDRKRGAHEAIITEEFVARCPSTHAPYPITLPSAAHARRHRPLLRVRRPNPPDQMWQGERTLLLPRGVTFTRPALRRRRKNVGL